MPLEALILKAIGYGLFPLWLAAGFGDWLCHRATHIERTSGVRESALHLVLFTLVTLPVVAGLLVEITGALLGFALGCLVIHQAVSLLDTGYSQPRRHISPLEQLVHALMDLLPWFALLLLALLHFSSPAPQSGIALRAQPVPHTGIVLALLAGSFALLVEEQWRCRRARRKRT
jgi:hypothetical protein